MTRNDNPAIAGFCRLEKKRRAYALAFFEDTILTSSTCMSSAFTLEPEMDKNPPEVLVVLLYAVIQFFDVILI